MSGGRMKESSGDKQVTDGDARRWPQGAEGALRRAFVPIRSRSAAAHKERCRAGAGMATGRRAALLERGILAGSGGGCAG